MHHALRATYTYEHCLFNTSFSFAYSLFLMSTHLGVPLSVSPLMFFEIPPLCMGKGNKAPTNNICCRAPLAWVPMNETLSRMRTFSLELSSSTNMWNRFFPFASLVNCYKRAGGGREVRLCSLEYWSVTCTHVSLACPISSDVSYACHRWIAPIVAWGNLPGALI